MATITEERINGNTARRDGDGYAEKQLSLLVAGLPKTVSQDDLLSLAIAAVDTAGYTIGSAHSYYTGLQLREQSPRALDETSVRVGLAYGRPDTGYSADPGEGEAPSVIAVAGSTTRVIEKTNKDSDGSVLTVEWLRESGGTEHSQPVEVEKGFSAETLEFRFRLHRTVGGRGPRALSKALINKRNAAAWQGEAAGQWLCIDAGYDSPDSDYPFDVSLRFAHDPGGWIQRTYFLMDDGNPPPNWNAAYNDDKTVKVVQVNGEADYATIVSFLPTVP